MPLIARKHVLQVKNEGTYGVDAVPAAGDSMLVSGLKFTPLAVNATDRSFAKPWFGADGKIIASSYGKLEFDVECAGSGAAGTAPRYGALLKSCAMSENVNAGVSVVYAPASAAISSASCYYFEDGIKYALLGARGTQSLKFSAGGVPMMHFTFTGLRVAPTDTALPTPTLPAIVPVAVNQANTTFNLGGYSGVLQELSGDFGLDVKYLNRPNSESVQILGRKATGSVTLEKTLLATKNWYTVIGGSSVLTLTHGTVAGNKFKVDAPAAQIISVENAETDGVAMVQLGLEFVPSAGNDEVTITIL